MAKQVLNKSTPSNRVDHVDQRNKINANFTEIYEGKVDKEAGKSLVSTAEKADWNSKQPATNFKTVNGDSIVGTGNIVISGGGGNVASVNGILPDGAKNVVLTTDNISQTADKQYVSTAEKSNWNGASIGSNLGLLKTTDTPPPTGTHKGDVNSAGTYTNFKDASSVAISFTVPELADNFGYIYVEDNVATKSLISKKGGSFDDFFDEIIADPTTVTSLNNPSTFTKSFGTLKNDIGLPTSIIANLSNGSTETLAVTWNNATPTYNGSLAGTYTFEGTLSLISGITNPSNIKASATVIINAEVSRVRRVVGSYVGFIEAKTKYTIETPTGGKQIMYRVAVDPGQVVNITRVKGDKFILAVSENALPTPDPFTNPSFLLGLATNILSIDNDATTTYTFTNTLNKSEFFLYIAGGVYGTANPDASATFTFS